MDTPFDPTLEDDIKQLLTEVPLPVRAYLASGRMQTVAKNLMQKNQLHIDQAAILERETVLLLLGLKDSTEFIQTLTGEAHLDTQTIDGIIQDINEQIFLPLREEMRKGGSAMPSPMKPAAAEPPRASVPQPQPQMRMHLQNKIPPPAPLPSNNAPLPPKLVMPRPVMVPQMPVRPLLPLGEEPSAPAPSLNQILRKTSPPQPYVPKPVAPLPMNLPGTNIPVPTPIPSTPPAKSYSSDPYREPIE